MKDFKVVLKFSAKGVKARCVQKETSENEKKKVDKKPEKA